MNLGAIAVRASTARRLGLTNVAHAMVHRLKARSGAYSRLTPIAVFGSPAALGPGRHEPKPIPTEREQSLLREADDLLRGRVRLFFRHKVQVGDPPAWHANPFNGVVAAHAEAHWGGVTEFDRALGDIKTVWELSRFDWLLTLSRAYTVTLDKRYLEHANKWLEDWQRHNPANAGPNWRCGQETALRALATLTALRLSGAPVTAAWDTFFITHVRRIDATRAYAHAQQNNHAISEAVGLYAVGLWLENHGSSEVSRQTGNAHARRGRRMLEHEVLRLFSPDGSFAQHSVTYHRFALDLLGHAEWWRRHFDDEPFTDVYQTRYEAAFAWLLAFVDETTGDAPNLGPNDGAWPLRLSQADYRDFRPSLNLASYMLYGHPATNDASAREVAAMLEVEARPPGPRPSRPPIKLFPDGGHAILTSTTGTVRAYVRFPRYRFRPTHADPLHVDVWHVGQNIARDGGSYSYASEDHEYYRSIESHNTVQFDGREPMPVLGRFLHGNWLRDATIEEVGPGAALQVSYVDAYGARHARTIVVHDNGVDVEDQLSGFVDEATLRWRLVPSKWHLDGNKATSPKATLEVAGNFNNIDLTEGHESRYYLEQTPLPVLEVRISAEDHCVVSSKFSFHSKPPRATT